MAKARQTDTKVIILGSVLAIVLIGIVAGWLYISYIARPVATASFASFGPVVVRSSEFSIRATIAVQTRNEDAGWVKKHKKELDFALQAALGNVNAQRVRTPEGVTYVQEMLRDAANKALNTTNIQEVLLTDFIVQGP